MDFAADGPSSDRLPANPPVVGVDSVPVIRLDARIRNVQGRLMVAWREHTVELSETAGFIWRQLDGERTVREIGRLVAAEYEIDEETAIIDTRDLVAALASYQVVTFQA